MKTHTKSLFLTLCAVLFTACPIAVYSELGEQALVANDPDYKWFDWVSFNYYNPVTSQQVGVITRKLAWNHSDALSFKRKDAALLDGPRSSGREVVILDSWEVLNENISLGSVDKLVFASSDTYYYNPFDFRYKIQAAIQVTVRRAKSVSFNVKIGWLGFKRSKFVTFDTPASLTRLFLTREGMVGVWPGDTWPTHFKVKLHWPQGPYRIF